MKKIAAFCACCLIFLGVVYSREIASVRISTEGVNLSRSESSLLQEMVAGKLDSNLSKYTDLVIINSTNKDEIIKNQRASNDSIEAGKYKNASHSIFVKITKASSKYIVTVRFTDLTTGENIATVTSNGRRNSEELYSGYGCAVDEITIGLNDKLNFGISELQKKIIMEGEENLSEAEKNQLYEYDIKQYEKIVSKLDSELWSLRHASSMEEIDKRRKLEAKKSEAEERLKVAEENKKRSQFETEKRHEDELRNKDRSSEQINKINSMTTDLNNKIAALRSKKQEELSLLQAVKIIESKKEYYISTRNQLNKDLAEMQKAIDEKKASVTAAIDNRDYRIAELSGGKPTEDALRNRAKEKKYAMEEIDDTDGAAMDDFNKEISGELKKIEREINSDYKSIKPKTVTSLTSELIVSYGNYDGENEGWPLYVSVQIDDISILETLSFLPYEKLTGTKPVDNYDKRNPNAFQDFADSVDFYNSLFSQGKPVLTFSIDYCIYPMDKNHPSEHNIEFTDFSFYETTDVIVKGNQITSKPKGVLKLQQDEVSRQFYPVHDMRTEEELADWDSHAEDRKRAREAQLRREEAAKEREARNEEITYDINSFFSGLGNKFSNGIDYHSKNKNTNIFGVSFEAAGGNVIGAGIEASYNYSFTDKFYFGYACDIIFSNESLYYGLTKENDGVVVTNQLLVGYKFNMEWLFGSLFRNIDFMTMPELYTSIGMGFNVCSPEFGDTSANFITEFQTGLETTILDTFQLISSLQLLIGFGRQEVSNESSMTSIGWTFGAGYRF